MIEVFIIDEQPLFREGIRASLSQMSDIEISGEANVDESVLSIIEISPPDVVFLGAGVTSSDGLKLCQVIK